MKIKRTLLRTLCTGVAVTGFALGASTAYAGSEIDGHLINKPRMPKSTAVGIGRAQVTQGAIVFEHSKQKGNVINDGQMDKAKAVAIGRAKVTQGAIVVK